MPYPIPPGVPYASESSPGSISSSFIPHSQRSSYSNSESHSPPPPRAPRSLSLASLGYLASGKHKEKMGSATLCSPVSTPRKRGWAERGVDSLETRNDKSGVNGDAHSDTLFGIRSNFDGHSSSHIYDGPETNQRIEEITMQSTTATSRMCQYTGNSAVVIADYDHTHSGTATGSADSSAERQNPSHELHHHRAMPHTNRPLLDLSGARKEASKIMLGVLGNRLNTRQGKVVGGEVKARDGEGLKILLEDGDGSMACSSAYSHVRPDSGYSSRSHWTKDSHGPAPTRSPYEMATNDSSSILGLIRGNINGGRDDMHDGTAASSRHHSYSNSDPTDYAAVGVIAGDYCDDPFELPAAYRSPFDDNHSLNLAEYSQFPFGGYCGDRATPGVSIVKEPAFALSDDPFGVSEQEDYYVGAGAEEDRDPFGYWYHIESEALAAEEKRLALLMRMGKGVRKPAKWRATTLSMILEDDDESEVDRFVQDECARSDCSETDLVERDTAQVTTDSGSLLSHTRMAQLPNDSPAQRGEGSPVCNDVVRMSPPRQSTLLKTVAAPRTAMLSPPAASAAPALAKSTTQDQSPSIAERPVLPLALPATFGSPGSQQYQAIAGPTEEPAVTKDRAAHDPRHTGARSLLESLPYPPIWYAAIKEGTASPYLPEPFPVSEDYDNESPSCSDSGYESMSPSPRSVPRSTPRIAGLATLTSVLASNPDAPVDFGNLVTQMVILTAVQDTAEDGLYENAEKWRQMEGQSHDGVEEDTGDVSVREDPTGAGSNLGREEIGLFTQRVEQSCSVGTTRPGPQSTAVTSSVPESSPMVVRVQTRRLPIASTDPIVTPSASTPCLSSLLAPIPIPGLKMNLNDDTQSYFTRAFEDDVFGPSVNCPPLEKDQKIQKIRLPFTLQSPPPLERTSRSSDHLLGKQTPTKLVLQDSKAINGVSGTSIAQATGAHRPTRAASKRRHQRGGHFGLPARAPPPPTPIPLTPIDQFSNSLALSLAQLPPLEMQLQSPPPLQRRTSIPSTPLTSTSFGVFTPGRSLLSPTALLSPEIMFEDAEEDGEMDSLMDDTFGYLRGKDTIWRNA